MRKYSVWSPSQYHDPVTGLELVTSSDRSTAARLLTGALNVSRIGMPDPVALLVPLEDHRGVGRGRGQGAEAARRGRPSCQPS